MCIFNPPSPPKAVAQPKQPVAPAPKPIDDRLQRVTDRNRLLALQRKRRNSQTFTPATLRPAATAAATVGARA